jgi:hypothetical protein
MEKMNRGNGAKLDQAGVEMHILTAFLSEILSKGRVHSETTSV